MGENRKKKIWIIVICICVAAAIIFGMCWSYYRGKLGLLQYDEGSRIVDTDVEMPIDDLDIPDFGKGPQKGAADLPTGDVVTDQDVVNILLLGTDERSTEFSENARADSIMILSLNTQKHTIKLVSIERGIGVPVPGRNDDWITHTFRYGGAALTMQTVRDCFKVDVDRYIRVNFNVFKEGIDAIGGVDIDITQAEADYMNDPNAQSRYGTGIQTVKAGRNHVNGATALNYARIRKIDSDWRRIERQRNVIQAALNQVAKADLRTLNNFANTILPMIQTNLNSTEITELLFQIPAFLSSGAQMEQITIPAPDTAWNSVGVDGRKMIGVDFQANAEILQEFFYGEKANDQGADAP